MFLTETEVAFYLKGPISRLRKRKGFKSFKLVLGGGHRYLDTWIPKICQVSKKKVSNSIQEYPKVSVFFFFFVDQSHPLNQLILVLLA